MKQRTDRRTILLAIGAAAMIMTTHAAATEQTEIRGEIEFADAETIPQGEISIYLEDTAQRDTARDPATDIHIASNGKSQTINFAVPLPANSKASTTLQLVARLERTDGWLLARGSTSIQSGETTNLVLYTVMY